MPIYIHYARLSLKARKRIRQIFLSFIYFPIIGSIYHRLYCAQIRKKASHGLMRLEIESHNVCNLKCVMCPYPIMTREKTLMKMELFEKIVDDGAASGIREINLSLCGEPFLDTLLFERIRYVKSKGMQSNFYSNGTLLTKDRIDTLLETGLDSIIFSFDGGTKETYERIRVGADFKKTKGNLIGLIKERNRRGLKKPTILITFTTQKENSTISKPSEPFGRGLLTGLTFMRLIIGECKDCCQTN